jgi:hypothetical protein
MTEGSSSGIEQGKTEGRGLIPRLASVIKPSGTRASLERSASKLVKNKVVGINFRKLFGRRETVRTDDLWASLTDDEFSVVYGGSILGNTFAVRDADRSFVSILEKSREIRTDSDLRLNAARLVGEGVSEKSVIEVLEKGTLASDEAVDEVFKRYIRNYAQARELFTTEHIGGLWIGKSVLDTSGNFESKGIPRQAIYEILKKTDSWKLFVGSSKLSAEDLRVLFPEIKTAINLNILKDFRNLRLFHAIEESLGKENPALEEVLENLGVNGHVNNIGVELFDNGGEYKSVFKVTITPETGKEKVVILKIYKSAIDSHLAKSETIYEDVQEFKVIKSLESTGAAQKIYTKEPVFIDYFSKRQMLVFEEFIDGKFVDAFREADTGTIKEIAFAYGENVAKIWNGTKITIDDMEKGAIPEDNFLHNTFFVREDGRWVAKTFDFTTVFTGYGRLEDAVAWKIEAIIAEFAGVNIVTDKLTVPGDPAVAESYLLGVTSQLGEKRNEFLQRLLSVIEKGRGPDYPPLKNIREAVEKLTSLSHGTVK